MSVLEIRAGVLKKISTIDNEKTLKILDNLLDLLSSKDSNDSVLTEEQKQLLQEGYERRNDVEGKITHEEFMKKARAWIK